MREIVETKKLGPCDIFLLWSSYLNMSSRQVSFAVSTLYDLAMFFPKASILMFYYRLIPISNEKTRIVLHVTTAYTIAAFFVTFGFDLLWCTPVTSNWYGRILSSVLLMLIQATKVT